MFPGGFNDPFGGPNRGLGRFDDDPGFHGAPGFGRNKNPFGPTGTDFRGFNPDFSGPTAMPGPDLGFPNTPDFNPALRPNYRPPTNDEPEFAKQKNPGLSNFAPPGTKPQIGTQSSPNAGMDGHGGLIVTNPNKPKKDFKGDYDIMREMDLVEPPRGEQRYDHNMYI
jgi:hypothetical protein